MYINSRFYADGIIEYGNKLDEYSIIQSATSETTVTYTSTQNEILGIFVTGGITVERYGRIMAKGVVLASVYTRDAIGLGNSIISSKGETYTCLLKDCTLYRISLKNFTAS